MIVETNIEYFDSIYDFSKAFPEVDNFVKRELKTTIEEHAVSDQEIMERFLESLPDKYILLAEDNRGDIYFILLKVK